MAFSIFVISLFCLGWTMRILALVDKEMRTQVRAAQTCEGKQASFALAAGLIREAKN